MNYEEIFIRFEEFLNQALEFFGSSYVVNLDEVRVWVEIIAVVLIVVIVVLAFFIGSLLVKLAVLRKGHEAKIKGRLYAARHRHTKSVRAEHPRWAQVQAYMESPHPDEWKLAILEADSMLEDMMEGMGVPGNSLGERLSNLDPGDMPSLQKAWDAHKVRNALAHQGSTYELSYPEAQRTIEMFEQVLREGGYL